MMQESKWKMNEQKLKDFHPKMTMTAYENCQALKVASWCALPNVKVIINRRAL